MSRPRLSLNLKLIRYLKDTIGLGWGSVAREYNRQTGQQISRDTARRRYEDKGNHDNGKGQGFATVLRIPDNGYDVMPEAFISKLQEYDTALIIRLRENGLSWRSVASVYAFRTGRRICHKTAKRHYIKVKGESYAD